MSTQPRHTVHLDHREVNHLLSLLVDGREYYRLLVANPKCTEQNRVMYDLVEGLWDKLKLHHAPVTD